MRGAARKGGPYRDHLDIPVTQSTSYPLRAHADVSDGRSTICHCYAARLWLFGVAGAKMGKVAALAPAQCIKTPANWRASAADPASDLREMVHEGEDFTRNRSDFDDAMITGRLAAELRCYVPYLPEGPWARLRHPAHGGLLHGWAPAYGGTQTSSSVSVGKGQSTPWRGGCRFLNLYESY